MRKHVRRDKGEVNDPICTRAGLASVVVPFGCYQFRPGAVEPAGGKRFPIMGQSVPITNANVRYSALVGDGGDVEQHVVVEAVAVVGAKQKKTEALQVSGAPGKLEMRRNPAV